MKKILFLTLFFLILMVPHSIHADINSSSSTVGNGCQGKDSCWQRVGTINGKYNELRGMRVTLFNEKAERVSDTIDIAINNIPNNYGVKRNNSKISKIEYLNGQTPQWNEGNLNDLVTLPSNIMNVIIRNSNIFNGNIQDTAEKVAAKWFENNGFSAIPMVKEKLQYCGSKYISKCKENYKYYAVFEPTTSVIVGDTKYYGTEYELVHNTTIWGAYWINNVIHSNLPNTLYLTGEFPNFYSNAKIGSKNGNYNIHKSGKYSRDEALYYGVGIGVFNWDSHPEDKIITRKDLTCNVNVNLNECGESNIYEASNNKKECIVDNETYSYIEGCNLYCSDEITTEFNGFYGNFKGNNALGAIKSGKYLAIKSNPKITIKKTCYQSKTSNECPDVSGSFRNKLNSDYRTNKIYLNIDGKKYEFIGNSTITNNGYSSATITYEYKLDENVNKYIDIETMKGILNPNDKTYTNEGPTIITSKGTYGNYTYNFDVSETPLNKYTQSSSALRKLKNTQSDKYNFTNSIVINYTGVSGNKKSNYINDDLKNTTCSYVKYNTDEGCIGEENKCVDSVTCEVLNSCEVCECTGKYGCLDDGKCTPIPTPNDNGNQEVCDPEEKTCFPDLIYRPISLEEPFPGIEGKGRIPGNNWNKIYKTAEGKTYSYGDYYIRLRRGYKDYEIYQAEPLYVIKLDGNKIQAIRKYNDKHNYNDFELECINGENCISKFLRGTSQDFNINLIDSGTCKNINNHNFDSCIKNKGE